MTARELIEKLAEFPPEMPIYIGDVDIGPLTVYLVEREKIDEIEWQDNEVFNYKKIDAVVLWR